MDTLPRHSQATSKRCCARQQRRAQTATSGTSSFDWPTLDCARSQSSATLQVSPSSLQEVTSYAHQFTPSALCPKQTSDPRAAPFLLQGPHSKPLRLRRRRPPMRHTLRYETGALPRANFPQVNPELTAVPALRGPETGNGRRTAFKRLAPAARLRS